MAHRTRHSTVAVVSVIATLAVAPLAGAQRMPGHTAHWAGGARAQVTDRPGTGPMHQELDGVLGDQDPVDAQGRHVRSRTMYLHRGDMVQYGLSSDAMDALAVVEGPQGGRWVDDDGAGHGTDSLLRFTAPVDGTYRFIATTFDQGQTGAFHVTVDVQPGGTVDNLAGGDPGSEQGSDQGSGQGNDQGSDPNGSAQAPAQSNGGQTFGVFVGVTHYDGENNDLPGSAADASSLERAFERAGWMARSNAVVLTDANATTENVQQAFRQLAPRMTPRDTMVFFFDGHGGTDVLEMVGGELHRNELGRLLDHAGGRQLVVLDTCHAGGFASLVQGHPTRWGLFSSRASETSETADAVHAGGWLAYFFRQAVEGGVQRSPDGSVDFARVTQYVQAQYDQRGVTQRQHLVASAGSRSSFALGGGSTPVGTVTDPATAVATREPTADATDGADATGDDLGRLVGASLAMAGQVVHALVK